MVKLLIDNAGLYLNKIALGNNPIPIWPDVLGEKKGVALKPLHPAIPKALRENPDQKLYELLVLVDTIRYGKARERNIAIQHLKDKLKHEK